MGCSSVTGSPSVATETDPPPSLSLVSQNFSDSIHKIELETYSHEEHILTSRPFHSSSRKASSYRSTRERGRTQVQLHALV